MTHFLNCCEQRCAYEVPATKMKSPTEWRKWLVDTFQDLTPELLQPSSLVMDAFQEGTDYIVRAFQRRKAFVAPRVGIFLNTNGSHNPISYNTTANISLIHEACLSEFCTWDLSAGVYIRGKHDKDEIHFQGDLLDFVRVVGVEEAHHAVSFQLAKVRKTSPPNQTDELAVYDADDYEYGALKWVLKFAKERNMPIETQAILKRRLANARRYREQV